MYSTVQSQCKYLQDLPYPHTVKSISTISCWSMQILTVAAWDSSWPTTSPHVADSCSMYFNLHLYSEIHCHPSVSFGWIMRSLHADAAIVRESKLQLLTERRRKKKFSLFFIIRLVWIKSPFVKNPTPKSTWRWERVQTFTHTIVIQLLTFKHCTWIQWISLATDEFP